MTPLPPLLDDKFAALERDLTTLIDLLNRANETFWPRFLTQGLVQVRDRRLSGATYVLGCFGGEGTFSDLTLTVPLQQQRLVQLRNRIFALADAIAAASSQLPRRPQ